MYPSKWLHFSWATLYNGVADLLKHTLSHTCCVTIKLGNAETVATLGVGAWLIPKNNPPPYMCHYVKFGSS